MMKTATNRILLIDDSPSEPILLESAIQRSERNLQMESFSDSIEAVEELIRRAKEEVEELPNLILLDLNMPGYNGLDVLSKLRNHERLRYIPIIIMSSSNLESDVKQSLEMGANCFLVKPTGHKHYVEVIQMIDDFWFGIVKRLDNGFI